MVVCVQHWDAFTRQAGKGNPAGIVLAAEELSDDDMQAVASTVGFNDTTFVLPSNTADLRIRYFGPRREVDLCGHATIAAFAALHRLNLLPLDKMDSIYTLETKSGVLPISIDLSDDHL
jgi:PhzF family phenazine biosynthesis protein